MEDLVVAERLNNFVASNRALRKRCDVRDNFKYAASALGLMSRLYITLTFVRGK